MSAITLVTGNPDKLTELRVIFPESVDLGYAKLNIPEIQGENADPYEIADAKLVEAYRQIGHPVIVEDISAELDCQNGLPGPFIKFYEKRLGREALWLLAKDAENKGAAIRCVMGYYDGTVKRLVEGLVRGQIVPPRGDNGFGFDCVFMPDGHDRTTAEMTLAEKSAISWRGLAARKMVKELFG